MHSFLTQLLFSLIGRRATYRIGQALYQKARGDVRNDIASNGETLVQSCVVDAWKRGGLSGQRLVIFDVGANVGDWSSALVSLLTDSNMCEAVDLYVFEPVPSTFEFLRNRLGDQVPVPHYEQVALSSPRCLGLRLIQNAERVKGMSAGSRNHPRRGQHRIISLQGRD